LLVLAHEEAHMDKDRDPRLEDEDVRKRSEEDIVGTTDDELDEVEDMDEDLEEEDVES
jgi:hypothetical protein